jgi:predicted transcriptional regulator
MTTITARVSEKLNEDLERLASFQDRTKSNVIKRAIEKYVIEMAEDIEDVIDAERVLAENNKSFSLEEVMKELNINIDSQDGNLEN